MDDNAVSPIENSLGGRFRGGREHRVSSPSNGYE